MTQRQRRAIQAGGQAYSEIVFFEDERTLGEFTSGNFEFSADVSAIASAGSTWAAPAPGGSDRRCER